jgi:sulfofructose kinase
VPPRLTGVSDQEAALRRLRQPQHRLLCVTLGERGALALDGDTIHHVPAFRVRALDTTGAGDVFRAGFIYALLRGWPAENILRFANAAAAVSCTRRGALGGIPALEDVETLARSGQVRT